MASPSPALFFDTINAYQRTEALRTAIELDLFTHIASGATTAAAIAEKSLAAPRGIRILADYLTILGFLTQEGEHYRLTPDAEVFLNRHSPAYLGGAIDFLLTPHLKESFSLLSAAVRRGGTAISDEGTVSQDNPIWVEFARAMAPLMQLPAKLLAELVDRDPSQPLRVLDVAAGHGLYGIEIGKRYPQAEITALDWPNVLRVAEENARQAGMAARHQLLPGCAFQTAWQGTYDVILLTNFLHHFAPSACQQIAVKAREALAPGGCVLTLEFIPDANRITPPSTANFALTMLATTANGDAYTFAEYEQIFTRAGFSRNAFHRLPPTTQQAIVSQV